MALRRFGGADGISLLVKIVGFGDCRDGRVVYCPLSRSEFKSV